MPQSRRILEWIDHELCPADGCDNDLQDEIFDGLSVRTMERMLHQGETVEITCGRCGQEIVVEPCVDLHTYTRENHEERNHGG